MKVIRIITILPLFIVLYSLQSQTYMKESDRVKGIRIDSIFEVFVAPIIPDSWKNEENCGFTVACQVLVDTNGKAKIFNRYPFCTQKEIDTNSEYQQVLHSIDSVSALWVFKPILRETNEGDSPAMKKSIIRKNKIKRLRPFSGKQYHIFVLYFCSQYKHNYGPQMFYWLNVKQDWKP